MDPDAALCKMREALACAKDRLEVAGFDDDEYIGYLECVAECAEALDGWLSKGGFLPETWGDRVSATRVRDVLLATGMHFGTAAAVISDLREPLNP